MHKFDLGVVGLRARISEEDVLETLWGDLAQPCGQFRGGLIRAPEEVVIKRQLRELFRNGLLNPVLTVPQVAAS